MLCFELQFPAGRYHATPWGAHVNEGLVEWPPSPWRLIRSLLFVGFTRLNWEQVPAEARSLVEKLAKSPPLYDLPPAALAHSRHYMPTTLDKTTKVIDAFAFLGSGKLGVLFEGEFSAAERELASALIERLPYLGRAESWVEGQVLEDFSPREFACRPIPEGSHALPTESVRLLAPFVPSSYLRWREQALELALAARLRERQGAAQEKGNKLPQKLSAKDVQRIEENHPLGVVEALLWDTGQVQGGTSGWDAPPASRWISYSLPESRRPRVNTGLAPVFQSREKMDTALLALSSDTRRVDLYPPIKDTLRRMELIHRTLVSLSDPEGLGRGSPSLTGKELVRVGAGEEGLQERPMRGHRHAFLIPLQLDCPKDRLDHVLVHAPMGFDGAARAALRGIRKTYAKDMPELFVSLAGLGGLADFESQVPDAQLAKIWRSRTPFVPPRFMKKRGRNSLRGQIEAELEERGISGLVEVRLELVGGDFVELEEFREGMLLSHRLRNFHRERSKKGSPTRHFFSLELLFERPVRGPIALGYGCHFGLGVFEPAVS